MKKSTIATALALLTLGTIPTASFAQSIAPGMPTIPTPTIPLSIGGIDIGGLIGTIQTYIPLATSILSGQIPDPNLLGAITGSFGSGSTYGDILIGMAAEAIQPVEQDGEVNLEPTLADKTAAMMKLATKGRLTLASAQNIINSDIVENAAFITAVATKNTAKNNKKVVESTNQAMTQAATAVQSLPIGTCDSSLCAENTHNSLKAQDINLKAAELTNMQISNSLTKISNDQQAIQIKATQDANATEQYKNNVRDLQAHALEAHANSADVFCRALKTCF